VIYDVTVLRVRPGSTPAALAALERRHAGDASLLACWYSELGPVGRILLLRVQADAAALHALREATVADPDPFGLGDHLAGFSSDAFLRRPGVPEMTAGARGPWFEVRDYDLAPGGLLPLLDLWRPALPARLAIAPMLTALYAVSGRMPRFLHLYPWPSLEERARVRHAARAVGWPPAGAHRHIVAQETTIYQAAPFSPGA
jgi:hypothetical protein